MFLLLSVMAFGQTNSIVTELYLNNNFTEKSGITPGANNTIAMDCDRILARYNVTISGTTTTGKRLPSQNQLTQSCFNVNDIFQGGKIAYKFKIGDPGYIAGECHGIIVSPDLGVAPWGCQGTNITGSDGALIGDGYANTYQIVAECTTPGIAAKIAWDYTNGGYSDWCLPSVYDLQAMYVNYANGTLTSIFSGSDYYRSSTELLQNYAWSVTFTNGSESTIQKNTADRVVAIRYF
jgi:hypothetical protein